MKCKHQELEVLRYTEDGMAIFYCVLCGEVIANLEEYDQEQEIEHILEISTTIEGRKIC